MTDHIYGRINLLDQVARPHMFIKELHLYINYLAEQLEKVGEDEKHTKYCVLFSQNLLAGIDYYKTLNRGEETTDFINELNDCADKVSSMLECKFPIQKAYFIKSSMLWLILVRALPCLLPQQIVRTKTQRASSMR
jgi:hypothetical protein